MTRRTRIYPKDHSWKRWKVVSQSWLHGTTRKYFKTYTMARLHAFMQYSFRDYMQSVDIIDQKATDD